MDPETLELMRRGLLVLLRSRLARRRLEVLVEEIDAAAVAALQAEASGEDESGRSLIRNLSAGVAVLEDGRLAFAVGPMPMVDFARALRAAGAVEAGYTDGSGSAHLLLADGRRWGSGERRPVASWLVVRGDEAEGDGGGAFLLLLAAAAAGLYALGRRR